MKRAFLMILFLTFLISLFGCDNTEEALGAGDSKITGSLLYFYGDEESAIEVFSSSSSDTKEITLSKGKTYKIELRPSFRGSKQAVYIGDLAEFSFDIGSCEINYIADDESEPLYALTVTTEKDFELTVEVDGYIQTITVYVRD